MVNGSRRPPAAAVPALLLLAATGCGPGGPVLHPAGGVVLLPGGEPAAGAVVEFLPDGGGPAARGRTDADGRFTLATAGRPGAVAGPHRVSVVQVAPLDGLPGHARHRSPDGLVPQRYASPATSGLTRTVADGAQNRFDLQLAAE